MYKHNSEGTLYRFFLTTLASIHDYKEEGGKQQWQEEA